MLGSFENDCICRLPIMDNYKLSNCLNVWCVHLQIVRKYKVPSSNFMLFKRETDIMKMTLKRPVLSMMTTNSNHLIWVYINWMLLTKCEVHVLIIYFFDIQKWYIEFLHHHLSTSYKKVKTCLWNFMALTSFRCQKLLGHDNNFFITFWYKS